MVAVSYATPTTYVPLLNKAELYYKNLMVWNIMVYYGIKETGFMGITT